MAFHIAVVHCTEDIERKIESKHNVTKAEVDEAVVLTHLEQAGWHDHPLYGRRLLVVGRTFRQRRLRVILYPVDPTGGDWTLGTALDAVGR